MSSTTSKSTKQDAQSQTFDVSAWTDQMKTQNERLMSETEKSFSKMMSFNQRLVEESHKAMGAQLDMQREWMNTMMGAARNMGGDQ